MCWSINEKKQAGVDPGDEGKRKRNHFAHYLCCKGGNRVSAIPVSHYRSYCFFIFVSKSKDKMKECSKG